ncbi:MAG TPA: hypothetical protein VFG66_07125, partial [Gemmatimonadales bacterium]|nr:hypothetical protein [Gemmatimonadales bacterium]
MIWPMASARQKFIVRLHLIGLAAVLGLGVVVAVLLGGVVAPDDTGAIVQGTLIFLACGLVAEVILIRVLVNNVLKPTGRAASIASRVAEGDLSMAVGADAQAGDLLSSSLAAMLEKLRDLVGTIRQH